MGAADVVSIKYPRPETIVVVVEPSGFSVVRGCVPAASSGSGNGIGTDHRPGIDSDAVCVRHRAGSDAAAGTDPRVGATMISTRHSHPSGRRVSGWCAGLVLIAAALPLLWGGVARAQTMVTPAEAA